MLNIGYRPTVGGDHKTVEVNIFDFDQTIYEEPIRVYFIKQIRQELKFADLEQLKQQLYHDREVAKKILT